MKNILGLRLTDHDTQFAGVLVRWNWFFIRTNTAGTFSTLSVRVSSVATRKYLHSANSAPFLRAMEVNSIENCLVSDVVSSDSLLRLMDLRDTQVGSRELVH